MDWFVKTFIKASLAWLALAVSLGVAMAAHPAWVIYRPAHLHMALLGFVAMMIFGVSYHVIPRFAGNALFSRRLAGAHWWIANIGLTGMVIAFVIRPLWAVGAGVVLGVSGSLAAAGAYAFAYNLWRTLDGKNAPVGVELVRRSTSTAVRSLGQLGESGRCRSAAAQASARTSRTPRDA